jgi:non-specific serine/threonine protein kinase
MLERVLALDTSDVTRRAKVLVTAAWIRFAQADSAACVRLAETALDLFRQVYDRSGMADALIALGFGYDQLGQDKSDQDAIARAISALQESLALARAIDDQRFVALATYGLGTTASGQGDKAHAFELFSAALAGFEACNDWRSIAWTVNHIALIAAQRGDATQAAAAFERAITIFQMVRDWWSAVQVITHVARMSLQAGRPSDAVQLLAAADAFHSLEGIPLTVTDQAGRAYLHEAARSTLGEQDYATALARGRSIPLETAIAHVLVLIQSGDLARAPAVIQAVPDAVTLTRREREVLRMLVLGLSDRQIAARLSVSPRTIGGHVTNLLGKLDVESRTAAAVHAIRYGLD